MKKSIFIILPLILWAFAACDNDDSEWDSGNLGVNSVEGTWQRVGAYPKVLAIFGSDYTSTIQTFDVDDNLVTDYPQGKYRVAGDSLLVYERGFINRFEFDNDELVITYGYNASRQTTYRYTRVEPAEPEEPGVPEDPTVTSEDFPATVTEGELITITGTQLTSIEKGLFGETEAEVISLEKETLIFKVPVFETTATVAVKLVYANGEKEIELSPACQVTVMAWLSYPNLKLGAHRNSTFGSMMIADKGEVVAACILTTEREREVDFATICNSPMDFNLQSPERLGKNLRNCWCEGKRLEGLTSSSEAEDVERLFPNYYSNKTTFLILSETDEAQKAIIDKVKDGKMVELSTDAFAGMDIKRRDIRTFKKDETTKDESIFEVGSVIAFKTPHKGDKIGIMRILSIGVDFTQDSAWNNENATITFDLYYQK